MIPLPRSPDLRQSGLQVQVVELRMSADIFGEHYLKGLTESIHAAVVMTLAL